MKYQVELLVVVESDAPFESVAADLMFGLRCRPGVFDVGVMSIEEMEEECHVCL